MKDRKDKIRDAVITTLGYILAGTWLIGLVALPTIVILGAIKLFTTVFGG